MKVRVLSCCLPASVFLLLFLPVAGQAQSVSAELSRADSLIHTGKDSAALQIYKSILQQDSTDKQALACAGVLLVREGERQKSGQKAMAFYNRARRMALTALRTDPNYAPAAYAYALSLYSRSLQLGVKDKIKGLREVKDYLDRVLMLDSSYARVWYLWGRWNMAFNKLNFAERAAVKLLFGGMPKAGAAKAVTCYLQCKKLAPSFIRNYYYLARALHAGGKDLQAIATLKEAIHLRPILKDDRAFQQKCRELIEALQ